MFLRTLHHDPPILGGPTQHGFRGGSDGKVCACNGGNWVQSLGLEDPWRRKWQPTPVLLPGKFHGLRILIGYSPWGHKELDTTERLHFHMA